VTWVSPDAWVGDDVVMHGHVHIEGGARVNHATLDDGVYIGPNAIIGHGGLGYDWVPGAGWVYKTHAHRVHLMENVHVHANTCIDRGSWRDTVIGPGTKIDNLVHIAHNVMTGAQCMIVAGAEVSGSCVLDDRVYIGPNACVRERLSLGEGCIVGMGSVVTRHVPPGMVVAGCPARVLKAVEQWPPPPPEGT
jgi:UDP-3-O-[3-hydroxymyristoyl] glucosamine N-acyltransferase